MRETKYNKLHGHKLHVALRREQLISMIMVDPDRKWSVRDMASEAQKLDWFITHQPLYSKSTASKDYTAVIDDIKEHREELADHYIRTHLETTDDLLDDLLEQLSEIASEYKFLTVMIDDESEREEPNIKAVNDMIKQRTRLRKERRDINNNILAVQRRQSTLVPISVPFEQKGAGVQINNIQLSLDEFQRQKAQLGINNKIAIPERVESEVIDGDYREEDTDEID